MRTELYRNIGFPFGRVDGVSRILCIGDSLTFGQGVQKNETLPAQLEVLLNKALPGRLVEVINGGFPGGSIYDVWAEFLTTGYFYSSDLVVLILCDNDAALTPAPKGVSYEQHMGYCWSPESPFRSHMLRMLNEVSRNASDLNVNLVLAFYSVYNVSIPYLPLIRETLSEHCKSVNLPFVDLSTEFEGANDGSFNKTMKVSEEDGHPSALAHSFAARRMARELLMVPPLNSFVGADYDERKTSAEFEDFANAMLSQGYEPLLLAERLDAILKVKRSSPHRAKLHSSKKMSEDESAELTARGSARIASLREGYGFLGYISYVAQDSTRLAEALRVSFHRLRSFYNNYFCLRHIVESEERNLYSPYSEQVGAPELLSEMLAQLPPVQEQLSAALAVLNSTQEKVRSFTDISDPFMEPVATATALRSEDITPILVDATLLTQRFAVLCEGIQEIAELELDKREKSCRQGELTLLLQEFYNLLSGHVQVLRALKLATLSSVGQAGSADLFEPYRITARATTPAGQCPYLKLTTFARVPSFGRTEEMYWLVADDQVHEYEYSIPWMSNGSLLFEIGDLFKAASESLARINSVKIWSPSREILLIEEGDPRLVDGRSILIPNFCLL